MKDVIRDLIISSLRDHARTMAEVLMPGERVDELVRECLQDIPIVEDSTYKDDGISFFGVKIKADDSLPNDTIVAKDQEGNEIMRFKLT
jgi:hypothetical protein